MWRSGTDREEDSVVCIACGASIPRSAAREYDKEGNRWNRRNKRFEHLCKDCHRDLCHQPREELEELLVELEGEGDRTAFLERYVAAVEERYGPADADHEGGSEERGR